MDDTMQRDETGLKGLDATMCSRLGLVTEIVRQCRSKCAHPAHRTSLVTAWPTNRSTPITSNATVHRGAEWRREWQTVHGSSPEEWNRAEGWAYVIGRPAGAASPKPTSPSLTLVQMASTWAAVSIGPPGRKPSEQMIGSAHRVHDGVELMR